MRRPISPLIVFAGLALGFGAYQFAPGSDEFNILAPPALAFIVISTVLHGGRAAAWLFLRRQPVLEWVMQTLTRWIPPAARWVESLPNKDRRAKLQHATTWLGYWASWLGIGLALGVIAGMYARGLAVRFTVGWESTFLAADHVAMALTALLAPGALVFGLELPSPAAIRALERPVAGAPENLARLWFHLWAAAIGFWVVLPRAFLLIASMISLRRCARAFRSHRKSTAPEPKPHTPLVAVAYSLPGNRERVVELKRELERFLKTRVTFDEIREVRYGDEDDLDDPTSAPGPRDYALIASISSTPESETHGRLTRTLLTRGTLTVYLDASAWLDPQGSDEQRIANRRLAWQKLVPESVPVVVIGTSNRRSA